MDSLHKLVQMPGVQKPLLTLACFCSTDMLLHYVLSTYIVDLELGVSNNTSQHTVVSSLNYFSLTAWARGIMLTLTIGFWCRFREKAIEWTKLLQPASLAIAMVAWIFLLVKLLYDNENNSGFDNITYKIGFYWSCLAIVIFHVLWCRLCSIKVEPSDKREKTNISRSHSKEAGSDSENETTIRQRFRHGARRRTRLKSKSKHESDSDSENDSADGTKARPRKETDSDFSRSELSDEDDEVEAVEEKRITEDSDKEEGADEEEDESSIFDRIWRICILSRPELPYMIISTAAMCIYTSGESLRPYYKGKVIDALTSDSPKESLTSNVLCMVAISVFAAIMESLHYALTEYIRAKQDVRVHSQLFASLLRQEVGFFEKTRTGKLTSTLTTEAGSIDTVMSTANYMLMEGVKIFTMITFSWCLSWQLTLVTVTGGLLQILLRTYSGYYTEKAYEKIHDCESDANAMAEEVISSIKTVRSFGAEDNEVKRYTDQLGYNVMLKLRVGLIDPLLDCFEEITRVCLFAATVYYGGHLVVLGKLTSGNLVSFIFYQYEMADPLEYLFNVHESLRRSIGKTKNLFKYLDREPQNYTTGNKKPKEITGLLQFKNVSFSYPSRPNSSVLENVSFSVNPGEVVALVGPSGAGKSTCIGLMEHFYEPSEGLVLLDGVALQEYDHKYLHQKVSLVAQEPVLFARSIKDNILYCLPGAEDGPMNVNGKTNNDSVMKTAAKQANAHQFICDMRDGYRTPSGEKGAHLSGGQKQRIAIARALVRQPAVLLLDEATSALDAESEHLVQEAIYKNLKGRTVIIIAHRLSTVQKADRIIVFDKGRVVEEGPHRQLLLQDGLYAKLVRRQLLRGKSAEAEQHTNTK